MQCKNIIRNIDPVIMFILAGLTFCIVFGLSAPALLMNDEWITVNQVNQLATGSQLIDSEGKYGSTLFNEQSTYFSVRGNYLAYSLFLPLLSLPVMKMIVWSGDLFRLIFLVIWFGISISALLACIWLTGIYNRKIACYISWGLLFLFFCLFLINIYYYQPFPASIKESPIESAAVIFTNEVLFALIAPMLYSLFRNLSLDRRTALVGTLSVICCSTYFFWSTSAKDHLLIAVLLTAIFWIFSGILLRESNLKWFSLFAVAGLLCWARPEYGAILLVGLIIWKVLSFFSIQNGSIHINSNKRLPGFVASLLGILLGLTPFFLNNNAITGNPLIPPQYLYVATRSAITSVLSPVHAVQSTFLSKAYLFLGQAINFYRPNIENIFVDFSGIALCPSNLGVGILFISPIILPALLYGLIHYQDYFSEYSSIMRRMILFSIFVFALTIIAYLRVIHGSTTSLGSLPDMRYFSPLYLPLGIISVLLLTPIIHKPEQWLKNLLISILICAPILVIGTTLLLPYGYSFNMYVYLFMRILVILLIFIFGISALNKKFWSSDKVFPILFSLLVMIPVALQFFFVFINSNDKMNGYPFWQPVLQYLFTYVFTIIN